ncbi:MAG: single-stranded DNA-binding protein [Frankiales bacterium]|nr:single-stranded DNA-binding protein [Frankiales bacterium]
MAQGTTGEPQVAAHNQVSLVGRIAARAQERELPSGDLLCTWRLVVDRPPAAPGRAGPGRPVTVDTLDCSAWSARVRRTARGLQPGDVVAVEGALRRRFWRAGAAVASRCEVEVTSVRRLARGAPTAGRRQAPAREGADAQGQV